MRHIRLATLLLAGCLLPGCSLDQLPLVGSTPVPPAPPAAVAPTRQPTAIPPAATSEPRATAAPLPSVAPVATLAPAMTNALEEQQRLLVELYRRVNPAVVSIEVAGQRPPVEGAPTPNPDLPFAQGSG